MRRIAHISDLHFGRTEAAVIEALKVELIETKPDLIIISGDFTMRSRIREWEESRDFVQGLKSPWFAIPGNHDIPYSDVWERLFDPFKRFRTYISPETDPVWQDDEIIVVGLNSARRFSAELNWSYGRIAHWQMRRAERLLKEAPPQLTRIIVTHHPLLAPLPSPKTRLVGRVEDALACFRALDVRLALAGHLHLGYSRFLEPVVEEGAVVGAQAKAPERAATRRMLVAQAGSATSTRLRGEPNAYNRITVDGDLVSVEARLWTGSGWQSAEAAEAAGTAEAH